jgi:N-acetylmuramoyl-L-alanine amidase
MTGQQILDLAIKHIGEKYSFGTIVPKSDKTYTGAWDCAEFTSWLVYQVSGRLYGCANNNGDPDSADAYSGFWARDAEKLGKKISVDQAAKIPGAMVLRIAGKGMIGHIVVSDGYGRTVEAHSTKTGVIASSLNNRRWDYGILVPWIEYTVADPEHPPIKKPGKIYRFTSPMMHDEVIKKIQTALLIKADGWYGPQTMNAVRSFQKNSGLVADGEVGFQTAEKLGLII